MIRLTDALLLASTKLRTRKIRLYITVAVSALLFAGLVLTMLVIDGLVASTQDFGKEGYGGRFIAQATPVTYQVTDPGDKQLIDMFLPIQRDLITQKKQAAKKLNVPYDEATDTTLPVINNLLNPSSPLVTEYITQSRDSVKGTAYDEFAAVARQAGAVQTFRSTASYNGITTYGVSAGQSTASVLVDGKENFDPATTGSSQGPLGSTGVQTIMSQGWKSADSDLLKPFVLPGQTLTRGSDGSVPVIAPFSAAEEILGLKPLPQTATSQQKISRLVEVRSKIAGSTAALCYRNGASAGLVSQALQQTKELASHKNDKNYTKPSLVYALPATACGPAAVATDTRTSEEKKQAANQQIFDKQFGKVVEPKQSIVTVRIVGLSPDISYESGLSAASILSSLLSSSLGSGWVSPAAAVAGSETAKLIIGGNVDTLGPGGLTYYAEFKNLPSMEAFINEQTCAGILTFSTGAGTAIGASTQEQPAVTCAKQGKPFTLSSYGNSAGAVEQFREGLWNIGKFVILGIAIAASLIMMGNIGKIIADSRRETAVFRALGAKRQDIAQIYLTYASLTSILVIICAVILGAVGAYLINRQLSDGLSVAAVIAYNAADVHKQFSLFSADPQHLLVLAALILATGVISAILPLLANVRRNPIRDMRDEN